MGAAFPASTQAPFKPGQIQFDSFTGIYHLSRDSRGLSLLTTEETIQADFPDSGYYGITRALPKKFQDHSVNVKILNVADAAGNPVPYKTATDKNLVITTGDPSIILSGSQTIKITYQTSGVISLQQKSDEFLLNVNGRGWDQPFNKVNATLYVPASFSAKLQHPAACYTVLGNTSNNACEVSTKKTTDKTTVASSAKFLAPHQALVLKLDFSPTTFTNRHNSAKQTLIIPVIAVVLAVPSIFFLQHRKRM